MKRHADAVLSALIRFAHETLGLSPNALSIGGFIVGLAGAAVTAAGSPGSGLALMAFSQIIDGLDGGVARRYGLTSARGQLYETLFDRGCELAMFLAFAANGMASLRMALLAFAAILLVTWLEPKSHFDPGFKRFMLYFGYALTLVFDIRGIELALNVVFFANLAVFMVGTIMVDYRFQAAIDREAILRRERETALGIPQPEPDPPSFLSKLFS